jgi:hypothetical protein
MASPDVSKYVDLTVYDEKASTSLQTILQAARAFVPGWVPDTGQIEVALAEAIARRSSEVVHSINRLPGATVETLLELFGITRSVGVQATATVKITAYGNFDLPAASELLYVDTGTSVSYVFTTNTSVNLTPVKATGKLTLAGVTASTTYPAGTQFSVTVGSTTYTYTADSDFTTDGSGNNSSVTVTATVFGKDHNDVTHGGSVTNGAATFTFSGIASGTVTAQTGDTNGFINGANDHTTVVVTAQDVGSLYNISVLSQPLTLLNAATNFKEAEFTVTPSGGENVENDDTYLARGVSVLSGYSAASTTDNQIKNYIANNKTYAYRVAVFDRRRYRDRDTTASSYGFHNGHVLVAVGGSVGSAASASTQVKVSSANLADLHTSLTARVPSSLSVDVMSAELVDVDVTATVVKKSGTTASTVKTSIENALKAYLDANAWNWEDNIVRRNEIISLIDAVTGVDYVSALTMSGDTLVGTNGIGYNASTGGSKTTVNLDLAGATNATYAVGEATVFYVDSTTDPDSPAVYAYTNTESITVSGGTATNKAFQAVANGVNYNDTNNNGKLPTGTGGSGPSFTGSAGDQGGTATVNSGSALSGGVSDTTQFVALSGSTFVSTDLVLRNLGTLVTYGALSITCT